LPSLLNCGAFQVVLESTRLDKFKEPTSFGGDMG